MPSDFLTTLLMFGALGVAFYFLMWRPAQKKMKEQQATMNSLAEGSRVMLTSGIFGTVRHLGERQMIVELAPGLEVTVLRQALAKIVTTDDDEFEYSDDAAEPTPAVPLPGEVPTAASEAPGVVNEDSPKYESYFERPQAGEDERKQGGESATQR